MKRHQQGMMLLEAMIAVILLGIGLIGSIMIQARSFSALSEATMRTEATMASESMVALIANDMPNSAQYALVEGDAPGARVAPWAAETRRLIPDAKLAIDVTTPTAGASYRRVVVTIKWTRKAGEQENRHILTSHLSGAR